MNKDKVLIVGPWYDSKGGISNVLALYKKSGLIDDENILFLLTYSTKKFIYHIFLIKFLYLILLNKSIKLIHIHSASRGSFFRKVITLTISKIFSKKVIFHVHGAEFIVFWEKSILPVKKIIEFALKKADLVITLSEQWKNDILNICKEANVKVVYNPVEIPAIVTRNERQQVNITFMGRLGKRKGVYEIIEAASKIRSDKFIINLFGDGELEEFQQIINKKGLNNKVKIKGWISGEEKLNAYLETDIYILPSYNEGMPMSVLEAMSYQLPVISTYVGGIPKITNNEVNGFLIQPGDSDALAEKLSILINNPELRNKMGQESYRIVKSKCDILNIKKELKALYEEISL